MADEKAALTEEEVKARLAEIPNWKYEEKALVRVQTFPQYRDALEFVYEVGQTAERENHHPDITMNFKRVVVRYWTHTARGVSALDFRLAGLVEKLATKHYHARS